MFDDDGALEAGVIQFFQKTTFTDLLMGASRKDLQLWIDRSSRVFVT